jgi:sulfotransferase
MKSFDQFICLSGLPRSGSTLLSAILSQNPDIHAEGNSPVCQLMWDMCDSISKHSEQIRANNKEDAACDIVSHIPHIYYKNSPENIVIDKCRSWTIPTNITMLETSLKINPKIIVMTRPILDIISSFAHLFKKNGFSNVQIDEKLKELLLPNSEPLMRSISGLNYAKKTGDSSKFLFVSYNDLVDSTQNTIQRIYDFCGWKPFQHSFDNVVPKYSENDSIYGLIGFHKIHPVVERTSYDASNFLSKEIIKKCLLIDSLIIHP